MNPLQVSVPDVLPADMLRQPGLLSMCAGDFVEVYKAPEHAGDFDCVATCFFIDTAHNILEYMDVIWHVLKVGSAPNCGLNASVPTLSLSSGVKTSWPPVALTSSDCAVTFDWRGPIRLTKAALHVTAT